MLNFCVNIFFIKDARKEDFELYFGSSESHEGKLFNAVKARKSDVFVYYSGHGAPGLNDKKGYFVPVGADPLYIEIQGYALDTFYENLGKLPARSIIVAVDACFSGLNFRETSGTMEMEMSSTFLNKGVVLTSSKSNQASTWHTTKRHGMFTYFFLKAIHNRNADFNKDDRLTLDEIHLFISDKTEGVPYYARRLQNVEQNPTIEGNYQGKVFVAY